MNRLGMIAVIALLGRVASAQETLPPGQGRPLVLEACVQCHDLRAIVSQRKPEEAWRRTVNEMIWRGAPLMPGEADIITKYLTSWRAGVQPALAARPARRMQPPRETPLPPGPGRELVLGACVRCHVLTVTTSQRKTAAEWRGSVERMVRLGAPLNGTEIEVVTNYLSRSFGANGKRMPAAQGGTR